MSPNRFAARTSTAHWVFLVYAVVVTILDFGRIGLLSDGVDLLRWAAQSPAWLLPIAWLGVSWGRLGRLLRFPPSSLLAAWTVLMVASVAWSVDPRQTVLQGLPVVGLTILGLWFVDTYGWRRFTRAVVTGVTIVVIGGLVVDLGSGELFVERSRGLTEHPTTLARITVLNLLLALSLLRRRDHRLGLVLGVIAPTVIAYASSGTRTPVLALICGLVFVALRRIRPALRPLFPVVACVAVVAIVLVGIESRTITRETDAGDVTTLTGRTNIWPPVIDTIAERPLLGHGYATNEALMEDVSRRGELSFRAVNAHNLGLSLLLSGGVVGALLFAAFLASLYRRRALVGRWVAAVPLVIVVNGLVESIISRPSLSILLLAGVAAAYNARVDTASWRVARSPATMA